MNLLIVGDVHGCYHTFKKLVKEHWLPDEEILIQVGDLINKGPHSGLCLKYWRKLEKRYPGRTVLIRGNHEQFLIDGGHFLKETILGISMKENIELAGLKLEKVRKRLAQTPLKWENEHLLITHAGVSKSAVNPYSTAARNGVLFNKGALKSLSKLQIKGHSIVEGNKPLFSTSENAWYIDTGAWVKKYLSAMKFTTTGAKLQVIRVQTGEADKLRSVSTETEF